MSASEIGFCVMCGTVILIGIVGLVYFSRRDKKIISSNADQSGLLDILATDNLDILELIREMAATQKECSETLKQIKSILQQNT